MMDSYLSSCHLAPITISSKEDMEGNKEYFCSYCGAIVHHTVMWPSVGKVIDEMVELSIRRFKDHDVKYVDLHEYLQKRVNKALWDAFDLVKRHLQAGRTAWEYDPDRDEWRKTSETGKVKK